ncbi:MAG: acylphosphatase [Phycisphaerales bacterium]|nr:MAG: acylphosphatase [Phycisphaerales bacterium]
MTDNATYTVRQTVFFSGTVQGVGFRYTTRAVAARFDVVGQVRNLSDGRVELVAEGVPEEVGRFRDAVAEAMTRYIRETTSREDPPTGEFSSFSIAF